MKCVEYSSQESEKLGGCSIFYYGTNSLIRAHGGKRLYLQLRPISSGVRFLLRW